MQKNRGITLTVLVITVIIMLIIISTVSYNSWEALQIKNFNKLTTDIDLLQDRVLIYYSNYGSLPILENNSYTKQQIGIPEDQISSKDGDKYYVINLEQLDNVTLNYGRGYKNIENSKDIYIINETSQVVYYMQGIEYDGKVYYTI